MSHHPPTATRAQVLPERPPSALAPPARAGRSLSPSWTRLALGGGGGPHIRAKLEIGAPDDAYEREADAVAERVMRMPESELAQEVGHGHRAWGREHPLAELSRPRLLARDPGMSHASEASSSPWATLANGGRPLDPAVRAFFEPRLGLDLARVRIHTDAASDEAARAMGARAATWGRDLIFAAGAYRPGESAGRHLLAHELAHVAQQARMSRDTSGPNGLVQRDDVTRQSITPDYARGLSAEALERDIQMLFEFVWMASEGEDERRVAEANLSILQREEMRRRNFDVTRTSVTPEYARGLTDENLDAQIQILYEYRLASVEGEDEALLENRRILDREQIRRDTIRRRRIRGVTIRGLDWGGFARPADVDVAVSPRDRMLYVMQLLAEHYGFSPRAAAAIVGNLQHESGVIPNMRQGLTLVRSSVTRRPRGGGIGLAQWTEAGRRTGLFEHEVEGVRPGLDILFDLDAQVDYLVTEMRSRAFQRVNTVLTNPANNLEQMTTEVFYYYEIPGSTVGCRAMRPRVCTALQRRITSAGEALRLYSRERRALGP